MVDYMEENNIVMYKYEIQNDDLSTFKIKEYDREIYNIDIENNNKKGEE